MYNDSRLWGFEIVKEDIKTPLVEVSSQEEKEIVKKIKKVVCPSENMSQICQSVVHYCWALDYPNTIAPNYEKCIIWEFDFNTINSNNNLRDLVYPLVEVRDNNEFNYQRMFDFVREWEWTFQPNAFCDSYYKKSWKMIRHPASLCTKWTIWFWTNSYAWEVIDYNEAIKRKEKAILDRYKNIENSCFTEIQKIVAVDFIYQYSSKYANQMILFANDCNTHWAYNYIVAHRDFYKNKGWNWMVKREQRRINYFNK